MVLSNRKRKLLAVLLTAGLMCSLPGMSALAGSTGVGAAKTAAEQGGPGVVKEQAPSQDQTGGGGAAQTPEQPGDGGQVQAGDAGAAQTDGGAQPQTPEQPPAGDSGQPLQINYSVFFHPQGWTDTKPDNTALQAPGGSWVTALKANLINIPAGAQVGVRYQVNLSGSGWLDWAEDGAETGGAGGEMPLEAVRFGLYGDSASGYDIYYRVLQNGSWTSRPMIALTFDDGPRTSVTSRILDSLQANGGRATFFMVGSRVDSNADVIRRMAAQGCEVANHTYDHKYITKIGADGIRSQVGSTNQKIQAVCGVAPTLLRPPGGYKDAASLAVLGSMGMPAVMWSIDTRDWQHKNSQKTIETVLSQVKDGDIILMHDIYDPTADAAVTLIPELTARGYQLVTVSELASYRGGMQPGHSYSQFRP